MLVLGSADASPTAMFYDVAHDSHKLDWSLLRPTGDLRNSSKGTAEGASVNLGAPQFRTPVAVPETDEAKANYHESESGWRFDPTSAYAP